LKLGELLVAQRERLGLSQQEVADRLGTNKSTISRYESGNIDNMRRDRIYKLSDILQLSTKVIMNWDDDFYLDNWEPDVYELIINAPIDKKANLAKQYGIDPSFINQFFNVLYPDPQQAGSKETNLKIQKILSLCSTLSDEQLDAFIKMLETFSANRSSSV
jgi:transcriptional regulator with XRE-family HTH domain